MLPKRVATFLRLGWRKQAVFLEALALVAFAFAATRVLPFRWTRRLYGRPRPTGLVSERDDVRPPQVVEGAVREVRWALRMVHERFGWDRSCLLRAIAGRIMLRRRGCASTMYIGARRDEDGEMRFHAWLRAGGVPVSGVREARPFTTLAVFDGEREA